MLQVRGRRPTEGKHPATEERINIPHRRFPPTPPEVDKLPLDHMEKILGDAHIHSKFPSRHPFMHRTATIDYIIVMYGEIDLLLDDSEVHLKAGDVLIQRSTNHSWVNRSKDVCRLGIVLLESSAEDQ